MLPLSLLALLPLIVPPQQPDPPPTTQAPAHTAGPRRAVMPKAIANALPVHATQRRVVVKLAEARPELLAAGKPIAAELLAVTGARPLQPFFAGLATELQALRKRQLAANAHPAVDLRLYFEVIAEDAADAAALVRRLNELQCVELAYPRELPTPPPGDILPNTPDYTSQQGYRQPAPTGIDCEFARKITGASGSGVRIVEIEWGWDFDHEDLSQLRPNALVGPAPSSNQHNDHGLAVIGELAADPDEYGITGLVPDIDVRVATAYPNSGYSVANAIAAGMTVLSTGDILVLEAQTQTPLGLGPTEWVQADFDAILIASNLGVITVEAAGNGAVDLDSPTLGGLFDRGVRDSGAILVGATTGSTSFRASFSSYGTIVDANGWGSGVVTAGYGGLATIGNDPRQRYTSSFSGTSSATPMVTAAVAALRGAADAQLPPAAAAAVDGLAIRALLRTHGTALAGNQQIGRRADLRALLNASGILRGLTVSGTPDLGQTCDLQLEPPAGTGSGDLFGMLAALSPANLPLPAPLPTTAGRMLLDPASTVTMTIGVHASSGASVPFVVPNAPGLRGLRVHVQAATFGVASGSVFLSNGCELFVRR